MSELKVCKLQSFMGNAKAYAYSTPDMACEEIGIIANDGDWEVFSDGKIEYRRRATIIRDAFYKIENKWTVVADESVDMYPTLYFNSLDRFTKVLIPGKNGENLQTALPTYDGEPIYVKAENLKYPGMTISICGMQTQGVFTDVPGSACYFRKSWEGKARHWCLFPRMTLAPGQSYEGNAYLSLSAPSMDHPGPEEVFARAEEILNA